MTKEQTYQRAREASEKIKQEAYAGANQLAVDCIDTADAVHKDPFNLTARAAREHVCSVASDARAGMYPKLSGDMLTAWQRSKDTLGNRSPPRADTTCSWSIE
jgi:hypothetical protein